MKKKKIVKSLKLIDTAMEDLLENGYISLAEYSVKDLKKARKALGLATAQFSEDYDGCPVVLDNTEIKKDEEEEDCSCTNTESVCTYMRYNFFGKKLCRVNGGPCTRSGCTMYKPADEACR